MDHALVDDVLKKAMEPVLRDLRTVGIAPSGIAHRDWTQDLGRPSVMLFGVDGSGMGIAVARADPLHERVAAVADQVQEWAIEELWGRGATNWPPCPQHPDSHPLRATTRAGIAVWLCPTDDTVAAPIGAL